MSKYHLEVVPQGVKYWETVKRAATLATSEVIQKVT